MLPIENKNTIKLLIVRISSCKHVQQFATKLLSHCSHSLLGGQEAAKSSHLLNVILVDESALGNLDLQLPVHYLDLQSVSKKKGNRTLM